MRIAYAVYHFERKLFASGVGRKIFTQCRLWREAGHEVQLFIHSPDLTPSADYELFAFKKQNILREFSRSRALQRMLRAISACKPDLIYLRYGLFTFPLQRLFQTTPVVVELNTNDIEEYRHRGVLLQRINQLTRGIILGRASGLVSTSPEIGGLPAFTKFHKPIQTITNGLDLRAAAPLPAPANTTPRLAFAGISTANWYGLDKLLAFARANPDITFDLIGYQPDQFHPDQRYANLNFHGLLDLAGVREILSQADAACSSLALHRNQMKQASSLKVREALAYGIPLILAYDDPDISGRNLENILELPNAEDNVTRHGQDLRNFVFASVGKRVERARVQPLIDQQYKEEQRLAFFETILQNTRAHR